jgi:hypothetical protein
LSMNSRIFCMFLYSMSLLLAVTHKCRSGRPKKNTIRAGRMVFSTGSCQS